MRQEIMGFRDALASATPHANQSAPCSRQTTTPTPHQSIFTGWMLFVTPNQQRQSTVGKDSRHCETKNGIKM